MKKGWKTKTLGEVCAFDKAQGIHRGLPYVGLEHIESHTARFIGSSEAQPVKSSTFRFSEEHVLYGRLRPYLNKALAPDFEGHCSTEIFPLKPSPELSREYLLFWLLADETCDRINATCTGARMPRAQMNDVLGFEIPVPPLAEQQRIVGLLDEAFEGLATAKANAEKNLQNARALFESHLQSVFTQRGPGWVETKLDDVTDLITCGVAKRPEYVPEGIPFLSAKNVKGGQVIWSGHQYVSEETHRALTKNNKPKLGDILYTRVGSYGEAAIIDREVEFSIFVSLTLIKPKSVVLNSFLKHYLNSSAVKELAADSITGSGVGNLNVGTVREFPIHLPPLAEQRAIVSQLDDLREQTQRLARLSERKHAALEALKKSLLHQAFTGEL